MINCGGKFDVSSKLAEINAEGRKVKVILMDSHRPFHHTNLFENKNIWIVDDGTFDKMSCPTEVEIRIAEEEIDLDEEDNKDEISEDEDEIDGKNIMQKIKEFRKQINGDDNNGDEADNHEIEINDHAEENGAETTEKEVTKTDKLDSNHAPEKTGANNKARSYVQEEEEEVEIGKKRIRRRIVEKRERRRQQENIREVTRN